MIPGPINIYKCPNCNVSFAHSGVTSGNTIGAVHYSDGKIDAPMLPPSLRVTKCNFCLQFLWLNELTPALSLDYRTEKLGFDNDADFLSIEDYHKLISTQAFPESEEIYIRMQIMQLYNDAFRNDSKEVNLSPGEDKSSIENLRSLAVLLDPKEFRYGLLKVETLRCQGAFEDALEVLESLHVVRDYHTKLIDQFRREILNQNKKVFKINI